MKKDIKIAIIGKTNNGKTTLINKLISKRQALSNSALNFTRDRKYIRYELHGTEDSILLIDTAGIAGMTDKKDQLLLKMQEQTLLAIDESDACIFVIDKTSYFSNEELKTVRYIQKQKKDLILVVNKNDVKKSKIEQSDLDKIGIDNIVFISAEHKINIDQIKDFIKSIYLKNIYKIEKKTHNPNKMKIAIVGRPNSGKSTFINNLLKSNRLITDDTAGTTRDSIYIDYKIDDEELYIVDTAGIRKKAEIHELIEKEIVEESFHSIDMSNICIIIIDITSVYNDEKISHQDLAIIKKIIKEGKPFLIVFNKKDLLNKKQIEKVIEIMKNEAHSIINEVIIKYFYIISAKFDEDLSKIIKISKEIHNKNSEIIKTSFLNNWLEGVKNTNMPIISNNIRLKLKFIKQIKKSPHYFMISSNYDSDSIPDNFFHYIRKNIQNSFELYNIPIRIMFKKSKNPYAKK